MSRAPAEASAEGGSAEGSRSRGRVEEGRADRVVLLWDEIRRLKREKNAFVPAHNYQVPEVQVVGREGAVDDVDDYEDEDEEPLPLEEEAPEVLRLVHAN